MRTAIILLLWACNALAVEIEYTCPQTCEPVSCDVAFNGIYAQCDTETRYTPLDRECDETNLGETFVQTIDYAPGQQCTLQYFNHCDGVNTLVGGTNTVDIPVVLPGAPTITAEYAGAPVTMDFVGAGTVVVENTPDSLSPPLHASVAEGDLTFGIFFLGNETGTWDAAPTGWAHITGSPFKGGAGNLEINFAVIYRIQPATPVAPTLTHDSPGFGTGLAITQSYSGNFESPMDVVGTLFAPGNITGSVGPIPGIGPIDSGAGVLVLGFHSDEVTSHTTLTDTSLPGDESLAWTQAYHETTSIGPDGAIWADHVILPETVTVDDQTFALTGSDNFSDGAGIMFSFKEASAGTNVSAGTESLDLTPNAAAIFNDVEVAATPETLTITPSSGSISLDANISASPESLALTPLAALVQSDINVLVNTQGLTLSSLASDIASDVNVGANTESLQITPLQAAIGADNEVSTGTESLTLTALQSSVQLDIDVSTALETLQITPLQATIGADNEIAANAENLTISPLQANITTAGDILTNTEILTLSPLAASIEYDVNLGANTQNLVLTPLSATVGADTAISANTESMLIGTFPASIQYGSSIAASPESLSLTPLQSSIIYDKNPNLTSVGLELTTYGASVGINVAQGFLTGDILLNPAITGSVALTQSLTASITLESN